MKYKQFFDFLKEKCNFRHENGELVWECNWDLKFTEMFCQENKLNFEKVKARLNNTEGFCDCEALFNSVKCISGNEEI